MENVVLSMPYNLQSLNFCSRFTTASEPAPIVSSVTSKGSKLGRPMDGKGLVS